MNDICKPLSFYVARFPEFRNGSQEFVKNWSYAEEYEFAKKILERSGRFGPRGDRLPIQC